MNTHNLKSQCEQAETYFYDFINDKMGEQIPEEILSHILACQHCRKQINRLKEMLSQPQSNSESQGKGTRNARIGMLALHFGYINKKVTCNTAKPFLPYINYL